MAHAEYLVCFVVVIVITVTGRDEGGYKASIWNRGSNTVWTIPKFASA